MASKIKSLNLQGCKHLRKLVIGKGVEFTGNIDLTDTPIEVKNDVDKVDPKFANIPEGVSISLNDRDKVKLAITTAEVGTQTEPVEIASLSTLNLTETDRATCQLLKDSLFWYEGLKDKGVAYLKQKQLEIKSKIAITGLEVPNVNIRLLAEHILFIGEKILENVGHIEDLKKYNTADLSEPPQGWNDNINIIILDRTSAVFSSFFAEWEGSFRKERWIDLKWGLARYRKLKTLKLSNTLPQTTSIPILPNSLEMLSINSNYLKELPNLPTSLKTLILNEPLRKSLLEKDWPNKAEWLKRFPDLKTPPENREKPSAVPVPVPNPLNIEEYLENKEKWS